MTSPQESAARQYRAALRASADRYAWINLAHGLLLVSTGALAAVYSLLLSSTASLVLACALIASALFQLATLLLTRQLPYFSFQLISVVSATIIGVLLLREGQPNLVTVKNLVLVFLVVDNFSRLIFAVAIRPQPGWWLIAASGVVGLMLAALLVADIAGMSPSSIAAIAGTNFIISGLAIGLFSWRSLTKK